MVQGHALRGPKSTDQKDVRSHRPFSDQAPPCGDRVLEERKIEARRIPPSERGRGQTIFQGRLEEMRVEDRGLRQALGLDPPDLSLDWGVAETLESSPAPPKFAAVDGPQLGRPANVESKRENNGNRTG